MRSLVLSLGLVASVAAHAAAQRPSITRPIQQAREAAAKSGARTATAEAAGQEPAVRRDSAPVTSAPVVAASKPGTTPPKGSATTAAPANGKAAAPSNGTAGPNAGSPSAATKPADSARSTAAPTTKTSETSKAPMSAAAPAGAATPSEKNGAAAAPPQAGTSKTAPGTAKAPATTGAATTTDAKPATPPATRGDSTARTISVGSAGPSRPELRIDREVFTYDAGGRRDPFVSLLSTSDLRPLFSDLLLVVINYDPQRRNSVAIMRDATTKEQYRVRQGQLIGRMRVAAIEQKRVLFTIDEFGFSRQESLVIGDTTKVRKQ